MSRPLSSLAVTLVILTIVRFAFPGGGAWWMLPLALGMAMFVFGGVLLAGRGLGMRYEGDVPSVLRDARATPGRKLLHLARLLILALLGAGGFTALIVAGDRYERRSRGEPNDSSAPSNQPIP
jgi:hypothetical protein